MQFNDDAGQDQLLLDAFKQGLDKLEALITSPRAPLLNGEGTEERQLMPRTVYPCVPTHLLANARKLRKNQTEAEKLLWHLLRNRKLNNYKFRRQHPLPKGFILDFYCAEKKLAIELDGIGHLQKEQKEYDEMRTIELMEYGIRVLRFWNHEVLKKTDMVLKKIIDECNQLSSPRHIDKKLESQTQYEISKITSELCRIIASIPINKNSSNSDLKNLQTVFDMDFWRNLTREKIQFLRSSITPLLHHIPN